MSVSVVLPFNRLDVFLNMAVESVLESTLSDFELIMVSDGIDIAKAKQFIPSSINSRVSIVPSSGKGIVSALNTGWKISKGNFVARMDGDDFCHPDRLRHQLKFLESNPTSLVVGSNLRLICVHGTIVGDVRFRPFIPRSNFFKPFNSPTAHPSVMMRKSISSIQGPYRQLYVGFQAEDFDLWNRILRKGSLANLRKSLLYYRIHNDQVSRTRAQDVALSSVIAVLVDIYECYSSSKTPLPFFDHPKTLIGELINPKRVRELRLRGRVRLYFYFASVGALRILMNLRKRIASKPREDDSDQVVFGGGIAKALSVCLVPFIAVRHLGTSIRYIQRQNSRCSKCAGQEIY